MEAARSWMSTELENTDTEDYFTADVGEDRKAYIEAERYNQEIDNDSSFLWMEGSNFIEEETIETEEMQSEYYSSFGMDTNGYTEKFHELADAYRKCMDKITFTEEDGKEQAEQVLEDLGIDGMGLVDSDRTVWFPEWRMFQSAMVWDLVVMLCGREIWIEDYRDICIVFRKV